jgi:beta-N-acetylglucosaminidase/Glycosyl hydrolase family 20, domain 2/Carbohydrate family 9 binding domain-like
MKSSSRILVLALGLWVAAFTVVANAENILKNPGFEKGKGAKADGWYFTATDKKGEAGCIPDEGQKGKRICRLITRTVLDKKTKAACNSERVELPKKTAKIHVSARIKGENVVQGKFRSWDKLRFVITAFDNKKKKIRHWDVAERVGTFDWTDFGGEIMLPKGTESVSASVMLLRCTGTAWVDNVIVEAGQKKKDLKEVMEILTEDTSTGPALVPYPWRMRAEKGSLSLRSGSVTITKPDLGLTSQIDSFFEKRKLARGDGFRLLIGAPGDAKIKAALGAAARNTDWKDLGDQGYVLTVRKQGATPVITIASQGAAGRLYGFQTLKQLAMNAEDGVAVPIVTIQDKPTMLRRGTPVAVQWIKKGDAVFDRLISLKLNYAHMHGGSVLSHKLYRYFRDPLGEKEIAQVKLFVAAAKKYHIEASVGVKPGGIVGSKTSPPFTYTSEKDRALLFAKLTKLYELGFRNIGLVFDDMHRFKMHVLTDPEDKKQFANIGEAHLDLCKRAYAHIKKLNPANRMIICPLWYYDIQNMDAAKKNYLSTVGKLPKDVNFFATVTTEAGVAEFTRLLGRPPIIWDNEFAHWQKVKPTPIVVPPLERPAQRSGKGIRGYTFLPQTPALEDMALGGWYSSADYAWAPDRYKPERSLRNTVALAIGKEAAPLLQAYTAYTASIRGLALPTTDKASRRQQIETWRKELEAWKTKLRPVLGEVAFAKIVSEVEVFNRQFKVLRRREKRKPFPTQTAPVAPKAIILDGSLSEAAWQKARTLSGFEPAGKSRTVTQQTTVRMVYDAKYLYMGVICQESNMAAIIAKRTKNDSDVFTDDCIDLFLDTNLDRETYYHLVVNTLGTIFDSKDIRNFDGHYVNRKWNSGCKVAVAKSENFWSLEIAIPLANLGEASSPAGKHWNFSIGRERYAPPKEFSAYTGVFHNPKQFWTMEFAK